MSKIIPVQSMSSQPLPINAAQSPGSHEQHTREHVEYPSFFEVEGVSPREERPQGEEDESDCEVGYPYKAKEENQLVAQKNNDRQIW